MAPIHLHNPTNVPPRMATYHLSYQHTTYAFDIPFIIPMYHPRCYHRSEPIHQHFVIDWLENHISPVCQQTCAWTYTHEHKHEHTHTVQHTRTQACEHTHTHTVQHTRTRFNTYTRTNARATSISMTYKSELCSPGDISLCDSLVYLTTHSYTRIYTHAPALDTHR